VIGFTSEVDLVDMVKLAGKHELLVMEDLGSGCLIDLSPFGLPKEPTVGEVVRAGVDVVTFSGDKLLGGPQAGIVVGRRDLIEQVKRHPLNRALRIDKLTLAFLEEVLKCYLDEKKAVTELPTLAMLTLSSAELRRRANRLKGQIRRRLGSASGFAAVVKEGVSRAGGGALPMVEIPTWLVALQSDGFSASSLDRFFRSRPLPIIARILDEQLIFDPRTLMDDDYREIARACEDLLRQS
jgi:L-seryl-tRNA(Ser) seleniumtransferase